MRKEVVLITGANGEIGHGLITHLAGLENIQIVALDVQPLDEALKAILPPIHTGGHTGSNATWEIGG